MTEEYSRSNRGSEKQPKEMEETTKRGSRSS
jgi:hypothetical protein